jgi:hypothetical protein
LPNLIRAADGSLLFGARGASSLGRDPEHELAPRRQSSEDFEGLLDRFDGDVSTRSNRRARSESRHPKRRAATPASNATGAPPIETLAMRNRTGKLRGASGAEVRRVAHALDAEACLVRGTAHPRRSVIPRVIDAVALEGADALRDALRRLARRERRS